MEKTKEVSFFLGKRAFGRLGSRCQWNARARAAEDEGPAREEGRFGEDSPRLVMAEVIVRKTGPCERRVFSSWNFLKGTGVKGSEGGDSAVTGLNYFK